MKLQKTKWGKLFDEATEEVVAWRGKEKKATLTQIEMCVDEELAKVRAQIIEDMAMASAMANVKELEKGERPKCPQCEKAMYANGQKRRKVRTNYEREIELRRSQAKCPECGGSFFPSG